MVVKLDMTLGELLPKSQPILIVEDSMPDYQTILRVFRKLQVANPVYHCETGQEALDYLYNRNDFPAEKAPRPGIILLDLNLPETDGRDILRIVKADQNLKSIPVVVFTTSEVREGYQGLLPERRQQLHHQAGRSREADGRHEHAAQLLVRDCRTAAIIRHCFRQKIIRC